jgi:23S rRNA pseudouridine1911/1915/1917 synthase
MAVVKKKDSQTRLDVFVSKASGISRAAATRLINDSMVKADQTVRKPSFLVSAGMNITWEPQEEKPSAISPWDTDLKIIYEDDSILLIDKPAGLVVHPGAGNSEKTLVHALVAQYPHISCVGSPERPGIVHRLDKLTSGVMVIAKTQGAYLNLSEAFRQHLHKRVYIAFSYGAMPVKSGRIDAYISRNPSDRKKMTTKTRSGRQAVTNWEVLKSWPGFSMLKLDLETGRTHQIRVHLSDAGHPVVGDPQYGGRARAANIANTSLKAYVRNIERQMLHAHILGIEHPVTGEYMEFVCALPEDMLLLDKELDRSYA